MNTPNDPTTVIPADKLRPGDELHLRAQGEFTDTTAVTVTGADIAAPPKRRVKPRVVAVIVAALLLLTAGAATAAFLVSQPKTFTVTGTFEIPGYTLGNSSDAAGYSDIRVGTEVLLTDEAGKMIAVGQLERDFSRAGAYTFTLTDVPAGLKFYGLTVARRGTVHYTEAQLRAGPHVTLGG